LAQTRVGAGSVAVLAGWGVLARLTQASLGCSNSTQTDPKSPPVPLRPRLGVVGNPFTTLRLASITR
jgi:hypothetical protein